KPDGLQNCTIVNQTAESLHVECTDGFDGGLPQEFIMEVYDAVTQNLVNNVTSKTPVFTLNGLESGLGFDISLYAANAKGRSDPVPLHAYTSKAAEKRTGWPDRPKPPEKCSIIHQTVTSLRVTCNSDLDDPSATYVLQAYDAETRRLVASATSETAELLEITQLPTDTRGLVLSVRTVTAQATSDAVSIYTVLPSLQEHQRRAATPAILHITPILGVLIGVVAALVLVAVIIVVVMRLRGHGDEDVKEREDGNGNSSRRGTPPGGDKLSSIPLSKDTDESIDSMDEKNPDIIPQNNDTDYQDPDEKAFEKLNNAPNRIYANMTPLLQSPPTNGMYENSNNIINIPKTNEEITYAELSLPKQPAPTYGTSTLRRQQPQQESTVYAQIDVTKKLVPVSSVAQEGCHPSALPLLHHPHLSTFQQPLYMMQQRPSRPSEDSLTDHQVDAETPFISHPVSTPHRESTNSCTCCLSINQQTE
ncbi:hypothetical protein L9F63_003441, partial [Diploptera punctata]